MFNKNTIIGFILGGIIFGMIGAYAATVSSSNVSYGSTNVGNALNDLYSKASYGNANASHILSGQTALVGGNKITGTMPNLSGQSNITHTSTNGTKIILGDQPFLSTNSDGVGRFQIRYAGDNGYITGNTLFALPYNQVASVIGLTADKIAEGQSILGINGSYKGKTGTRAVTQTSAWDWWTVADYDKIEVTVSDSNLVAGNIKSGVSILGVTGTYDGAGVYYLGTGTSFDIKSMFPSDYNRFTSNNFIVAVESTSGRISGTAGPLDRSYSIAYNSGSSTISKGYDSRTGILTITGTSLGISGCAPSGVGCEKGNASASFTMNFSVYLVDGNIIKK